MSILLFKSIHIIAAVAWFAGLFFLVRIFVYHREAMDMDEPKRSILLKEYGIIENKVYNIICNPAMVLTWICGLAMIGLYSMESSEWMAINGWLHVKLLIVFLLSGYQGWCKKRITRLSEEHKVTTSFQYRLLNELPTLFLIFIVVLATYRNTINYLYTVLALLGLGILFYIIAKIYKSFREKKGGS